MSLKGSRLKSALPKTVTLSLPGRKKQSPTEPPSGPKESSPELEPISMNGTAKSRTPPLASRTGQRTQISKRRISRRSAALEVLQLPLQIGARKVFDLRKLVLVLVLTGIVMILPTPEGLSLAGHRALALFVFTGSILALEPAPLPIAALIVPICQIALGIDDASGAFAPFGRPVVFLILGSLFLAESLRKHGLTRRLALYAIMISGGQFHWLLFGLMMITGLLSMWVLNTATAAVLIPVAITIAQSTQRAEEAQRVLKVLILGIAYSASLGAIATIMGSGENAIASGLLNEINPFGFLEWMKYGLPIVLILLPLSWGLLQLAFRLPKITIDTEPARREIERLGQLNGSEREILVVLAVSVALWISGSSLEMLLGLPATILSSAVIALGAVAVLSVEEVIDWNDLKGVNWGVFFVIGAGLTLGDALAKTGASIWFAGLIGPLLQGLPYVVILSILVVLAFVLTQFMNNVTLGAILAPILITLGEASNIAPMRLLLPTIMVLALAYMLPAASARMTLVAVTGAIERKDMVRAGFIVGVPSLAFIWTYFYLLSRIGWI